MMDGEGKPGTSAKIDDPSIAFNACQNALVFTHSISYLTSSFFLIICCNLLYRGRKMDLRIVLFSNLASQFSIDNLDTVIANMKKENVQITFMYVLFINHVICMFRCHYCQAGPDKLSVSRHFQETLHGKYDTCTLLLFQSQQVMQYIHTHFEHIHNHNVDRNLKYINSFYLLEGQK